MGEKFGQSIPDTHKDSRQGADYSYPIFDHLGPAKEESNPYEYNPYKKKER